MDEERPFKEAREALNQSSEEPTIISHVKPESETETTPSAQRQTRLMVAGIVAVLALIVIGLFLPPISLGKRLAGEEVTLPETSLRLGSSEESLDVAGEIALTLSGEADGVNVERLAQDTFLNGGTDGEWAAAAGAIPGQRRLSSNIYAIEFDGEAPQGSATIFIPAAAQPHQTLDLFGWDGESWVFIPSEVSGDGGQLSSAAGTLPRALALMQSDSPAEPEVVAELLPAQELPAAVLPLLTEVSAGTLTLGQNGQVLGEAVTVPTGGYRQLLRVTNTGAIVDTVSLAALLADSGLQGQQVGALVSRVQSGGYAGLNLDYQGVAAEQSQAFSVFVDSLASALHAEGFVLAVTLETPVQDGGQWDTAGQDWQAIGRAADAVYVQMPLDPTAYGDSGLAEQLLVWAVRQVDRSKLAMLLSAHAIDAVGDSYRELASLEALANFGEIGFVRGEAEVEPGTPIEVALSGSASPLEWDPASLTYKYTYEQASQEHRVWLNSEAVLSHRARLASRYHLRGLVIRGLGTVEEGAGYSAAIQSYLGAADAPQPASAAILWAVENSAGSIIASTSGESLTYAWEASGDPGDYTIKADFAQGDSVASLGAVNVSVAAPPTPTPEPSPTPEPVVETTPVPAAQATSLDPGDADAVSNTAANVRSGPGLGYGIIGGLQKGEKVSLIGRNEDRSWLQVKLADDSDGWVFATLLTVNSSVDVGALAVVEVDPPTTVAGGGGGDGSGSGTTPPPIIPPAGGGSFELGGQTQSFANTTLMSLSGMNWVKFQHKWGPGDTPDAVAGRIQQAQANGFKVLLSIPGASAYPGSIDFNSYVAFLGGVAALGPNAIEIWNEENIDFEWPAGQIDPASYVSNMLAPAYNAIKAANSSVMVVSGAPAPTGFDNGTNAWADDRYMAGVAAAGGASYMDCIGVHHNAGATSPNATSGHPAGSHYSWYFWPTLNMYYNTFGGARPVCFTELGYLSGQDFGGVPSRFSWAANTTVQQHAQWLAEAASLSANSGKVRLLIIFNVDFTLYGDDPQAGYAMLRPDGSCPSCDLLRQVMGG